MDKLNRQRPPSDDCRHLVVQRTADADPDWRCAVCGVRFLPGPASLRRTA